MVRVASLIASSTEIICALGEAASLVARSHECDFPPSVAHLPVVTAPKLLLSGPGGPASSAEIDRQVKALVADALSVYRVDAQQLSALAPEVIVTQTQCEVCAVSLRDVEAALCESVASRPRLVALETNALADLWRDIRKIAAALAVPARGEALIEALQSRIAAIAARARPLVERPTVACIEWIDPLMAAGNWMPELVELAGGVPLFGEAGQHSPWMTWEQLVERDPAVIVILPCGFDIPRARAEMPRLAARPEWACLAAVRAGRVFITDGNQFFNRPGPRLVESLEILAELLHPATFSFGHRGHGWVPYPDAAD